MTKKTKRSGKSKMDALSLKNLKPIHVLHDLYGDEVVMDEGVMEGTSSSTVFQILAEFELAPNRYAVLQTAAMKKSDEFALFHILEKEQGDYELQTIMD